MARSGWRAWMCGATVVCGRRASTALWRLWVAGQASRPLSAADQLPDNGPQPTCRAEDRRPMPTSCSIKLSHKGIQYCQSLQTYTDHHVEHEGALETAFSRLAFESPDVHSESRR